MSLSTWYPFNKDGKPEINMAGKERHDSYLTNNDKNGPFGKALQCYGTNYGRSYGFDFGLKMNDHWNYKENSLSFSIWLKFDYDELTTFIDNQIDIIMQDNTLLNRVFDQYITTTKAKGCLVGYNDYQGFALSWETNTVLENTAVPATTDNTYSYACDTVYIFGTTRCGSKHYVTNKFAIEWNKWHHVCLTLDQDKQIMSLYVDGDLFSSISVNIAEMLQDPYGNPDINENLYMNMPQIYHGRGPKLSIPYYISNFQIHDNCLSPYQVKEISKGLVIHYDCEDLGLKKTRNLTQYDTNNWWIRNWKSENSTIETSNPEIAGYSKKCDKVIVGSETPQIKSPNIFDISKVTSSQFTINYDNKTITVPAMTNNAYTNETVRTLMPSLKVGDTLYMTATNSNPEAHTLVYFYSSTVGQALNYYTGVGSNQSIIVTEEFLDAHIGFYNQMSSENINVISNIIFSKSPSFEEREIHYPNAHIRMYLYDSAYEHEDFDALDETLYNPFLDNLLDSWKGGDSIPYYTKLLISFKWRGTDELNPVSLVIRPSLMDDPNYRDSATVQLQQKKITNFDDYYLFEAVIPRYYSTLEYSVLSNYLVNPYLNFILPFNSEFELWDLMIEPGWRTSFHTPYNDIYCTDVRKSLTNILEDKSGFKHNIMIPDYVYEVKKDKFDGSSSTSGEYTYGLYSISNYDDPHLYSYENLKTLPFIYDFNNELVQLNEFTIRFYHKNYAIFNNSHPDDIIYPQSLTLLGKNLSTGEEYKLLYEKSDKFVLELLDENIEIINSYYVFMEMMPWNCFIDQIITFDGKTLCYYLNGELLDEAVISKDSYFYNFYLSKIIIGGDSNTLLTNEIDMQDFRFYSKALSSQEVYDLHYSRGTVDNYGNLHATKFVEYENASSDLIDRWGISRSNAFVEIDENEESNKILEIYPDSINPREIIER